MSKTTDEKIPTNDQIDGRVVFVVALDEAAVNEYAAAHGLESSEVVHCTTLAQAEDSKAKQFSDDSKVEIVNLLHGSEK